VIDLARTWWEWIAPLAWQATLIGALALAIDRSGLRRRRPEIAAAAWTLFFARIALPPTTSSPLSISRRAFEATFTAIEPGGAPIVVAFAIWIAVAVACLARGRLATRSFRCTLDLDFDVPRALARELSEAGALLGLRRIPRLAVASALDSPVVVGLFRPLVVLPRGMDRRAVRHALLHELAHVRRGDLAAKAAIEILTAVFWFHPLAWIGAARLARTRELLCDARVVEVLGPERDGYRLSLARAAHAKLVASGALAFASSRILERLAHLERPIGNARRRRIGAVAATLAAGCVLLPMASRDADLAGIARSVLERAARGERQSCFALHAAVQFLTTERPPDSQGDRR
jgi:beta-lactamase regulating signal transducer with metallopeptidase domain